MRNAWRLGDQQTAWPQGLHRQRQGLVQVGHQMQHVERQHGVVGAGTGHRNGCIGSTGSSASGGVTTR